MQGYDGATYGDAFAEVYDDWYATSSTDSTNDAATDTTTDTAVDCLVELAGAGATGPILELGVGTGRLAIPLAARGVDVHGIDTSAAMLDRLRTKDERGSVTVHHGDMVDELPAGPFRLVFVAANTLFNLLTPERQAACFRAVSARLAPRGGFVVEAFVAAEDPPRREAPVSVRQLSTRRVVLSVTVDDPANQRAEGQYVELSEERGVRLRPWAIRWSRPAELDEMAATAGLELGQRWASFAKDPFDGDSAHHVSVYRAPAVTSAATSDRDMRDIRL